MSLPAIKEEKVRGKDGKKEQGEAPPKILVLKSKRQHTNDEEYNALEQLFAEKMEAFVDQEGNFTQDSLKEFFTHCGFQFSAYEMEIFTGDLQVHKGGEIHYSELLEYMSKRGISNWLQHEHCFEIKERLKSLAKDSKEEGKISLATLEKALLSYLPNNIKGKSDIHEMLEHVPHEFLNGGNLDYEGYLDHLLQQHEALLMPHEVHAYHEKLHSATQ
uniref:EF-hand domain-containing protein n=1 Tax=Lotharella oceanica TaxID=641309 RepID=A0A7S2X7X8_9EUKA|eukprot:CAMPEP_0170177336 /NCGR_PEP_ID=MMETSP0040_2-20121228/10005_1 /TAXON_ID=641309 /ORGANISM="Lotharella oceanica, Strain CCMP622" /LENGTH=216 /DNA_ID=CAMNT_0010419937 /DNA_START=43 /DNA_END=693 /DNA_ORIENTATION=+